MDESTAFQASLEVEFTLNAPSMPMRAAMASGARGPAAARMASMEPPLASPDSGRKRWRRLGRFFVPATRLR